MTSVQSAQAAVHPGVAPLPPNLSSAQVRELYLRWQQMKKDGIAESNPEFLKVSQILSAVQRQSALQKQTQAYAAQQQMAQGQHNRQSGHNAVNGAPQANGGTPGRTSSMSPQQSTTITAGPGNGQPSSNSSVTPTQQDSAQKQIFAASAIFTQEQLAKLRSQIYAFRMITRNHAVPANVQAQLFSSQQAKQQPTTAQAVAAAAAALDASAQAQGTSGSTTAAPASSDALTPPRPKNGYETFTAPYSHLPRKIGYTDHASREKRLMIPSIMPSGVDIDRVREERERIIYNRIVARKAELEKMPANLDFFNSTKDRLPNGDDRLKVKALLEYKMLCLLPKQRAIRQNIGRNVIQYDSLSMTTNRHMYRRMKKQSSREARITEKLEKQQRDQRDLREKKKHHDYLQSVLRHGREINETSRNAQLRIQKLGRLMITHHQQIEKEEQKRIERTAKQRLQALKANDEEAYLKLLDQAKDTRITHLLRQTDGFLNQLAASVKEQQRSAASRYGGQDDFDDLDEDDDDDDEDAEDGGKKIDYFAVAHRIQETITEQPSILVGGSLKEYQIKGLQWMVSLYNNNLNGILADEMGLGKTIQTISLVTFLIEKKKQNGPFLIIVPLSTLTNWKLEFEKWAPSISKVIYKGPPNARKQQQQQIRWGQFQVLLTTYEYVIKDRPVLCKVKWQYMIVDEGHRMKNAQSKLSSTLTQYYHTRYRLILTGTPLQNNLPELWALLNFVLPAIFKSVKSFDEWFNTPFANTGGQDKMELTEEEQLLVIRRLHKVLRPFLLRRLKKDVEADLPEKQERVVKCKFSALQARLYKQMVSHNMLFVQDAKGGRAGIKGLSNMLMQLRKLCNHPFVFEEVENQMNPSRINNDLLWRAAGKFELLDRVLPKFKASGHRVLMFFQMTQIMNIMEDFMLLRGYQYLRLDGGTKADERSELLKVFNAPDSPYFMFLLSTRAGGLGLNLQTADTVIIFDSDWNPHQDLQAQDRAHRIGQKNEVRILRLITSNSVEEKILERAQYKLDIDGKVIQAGKFDNKSTAEERDEMLRTLLESGDIEAQENEDMDDDELNEIMARNDDEVELFRKMDEERERDSPYGKGKEKERLLQDNELPGVYLLEDNPIVEEVVGPLGRGARDRTRIRYDDGLTEEQWLEAIDDDEDTVEAAMERKRARIQKRIENKAKRNGAGLDSPADSGSDEPKAATPPPPKKRGRKPKSEKRKAEEAALEEPAPPAKRKRGRQPKSAAANDVLSPDERALHQAIFNNVYQSIIDLTTTSYAEDDDEPRSIVDNFMTLPSKKLYPDYYMVIQQPISMDIIKKKIDREEYSSLKAFRDDLKTLCVNARTYNEDGSMLFEDANAIEAHYVSKLKEEIEGHPELADLDEPASTTVDGHSTAPISSVGTPLAAAAVPGKLKITFNANQANEGGSSGVVSDDD